MKHFRLSALVLAGALSLSLLTACGGGEEAPEVTETPAVTESAQPSETPAASEAPEVSETPEASETPAVSEAPEATQTPEPTKAPEATQTPEPTKAPEATPTPEPAKTPAPTPIPVPTIPPMPTKAPAPTPAPAVPTPAPAPEVPAAPDASSVVSTFWAGVSAAGTPALMDLGDADLMSAMYYMDIADLEAYICKVPQSNDVTEYFMAKVKPGKMDSVKASIAQRQADIAGQSAYYQADQLELVNGYKLVTNGDYILFTIAENADQAVAIFNSCTK